MNKLRRCEREERKGKMEIMEGGQRKGDESRGDDRVKYLWRRRRVFASP